MTTFLNVSKNLRHPERSAERAVEGRTVPLTSRRRCFVRLQNCLRRGVAFFEPDAVAPQRSEVFEHGAGALLVEFDAVMDGVAQDQAAVAGEVDVADLD